VVKNRLYRQNNYNLLMSARSVRDQWKDYVHVGKIAEAGRIQPKVPWRIPVEDRDGWVNSVWR